MIDVSVISEKFNIEVNETKIICNCDIIRLLEFLKNTPEYNFNMLTSIVAVDMISGIELIYQLYSTSNNIILNVSKIIENNLAQSVVEVFKSAYFDECEIYDMFGINFEGNNKIKRLFMPESWIGHPLLKSYKNEDMRLAWNE